MSFSQKDRGDPPFWVPDPQHNERTSYFTEAEHFLCDFCLRVRRKSVVWEPFKTYVAKNCSLSHSKLEIQPQDKTHGPPESEHTKSLWHNFPSFPLTNAFGCNVNKKKVVWPIYFCVNSVGSVVFCCMVYEICHRSSGGQTQPEGSTRLQVQAPWHYSVLTWWTDCQCLTRIKTNPYE